MTQVWVRMELVPLPASPYEAEMIYWNPDSGELVGENVEIIKGLVSNAMQHGLSGDMASIEMSDPYRKPTELAAVLSQYFLVIPEPVSEVPVFVNAESNTIN